MESAERDDQKVAVAVERLLPCRSHVRRLLALLAWHKRALAGLLVASLLLNAFGLAAPRVTQTILDRVVPEGDLALLRKLVLALGLLTGCQILFTVWRRLTLVRMSLRLDQVLAGAFCAHLLALPAQFFRTHRAGDLVARLGEAGQVRHLFAGSLTRVAIDLVMVGVYFVVLFCYSAHLALVVVALLVAFAGLTLLTGPVLRRRHLRLQEDKAAQEARLVEVLTQVDVVKAMALEGTVLRKWRELFRGFADSNYRAQRLRQLLESAGTAAQFLCTVAILWYRAALVVAGRLTTGELVAFSMYTGQAVAPLLSLVTLWDEWQQARAAVVRVQEVLDHEPEAGFFPAGRASPGLLKGHVVFDDVHFHYESCEDRPILRGVSFEIRPGEHVALVGRSGSGKTTIARLLLGLYRPTKGRILIDGHDLAHLDLTEYRSQVAVVMQENLAFTGTIRENITAGDPEPNE